MKRRSLLKSIAGILIPAPMVVQASSLMRVKPLLFLGDKDFTMESIIEVPGEPSEYTKCIFYKNIVLLSTAI